MEKSVEIKIAQTATDFAHARELILEYVAWLGIDLSFQNFDKEMEGLSKMYSPVEGALYLANINGEAVGVAGLRRFSERDGELKRMFVKPNNRGMGIGQLLLSACLETARTLKYESVKLDTADFMTAAIKLYKENGFEEIEAYRYNPHESLKYFELKLTADLLSSNS